MKDDRLLRWLTKQAPLAPAREQFRLCRIDGTVDTTVTTVEKGAPAAMAAAIDNAMTSDLAALSGSQHYKLCAIGGDTVHATLTLRATGGQEEKSGVMAVIAQLAKLTTDLFDAESKRTAQFHGHVMVLLGDERQEIRDLRGHTAELTRELLDVRVEKAKLEASSEGAAASEITKQIIDAVQSLPTTIAYTYKAFKGDKSGEVKQLASPIAPLREAAKLLTDQEILDAIRILITHPDVAREIVAKLSPSAKAAVMVAVQNLAKQSDSGNPKQNGAEHGNSES